MANLYVGSDQTYKTIKEALNAAADNDTVIINAGDYTAEGTITIDKSITIKAANAANTAADADKAIIDNIAIIGGSADNLLTVEIDGLQINAETINDNNVWSQGVYLGTLNAESVTVKNCNIDLTNCTNGSSGIKMSLNSGDKTETIVIENNIITGSAENTNSLIHIGDKESLQSLSVKNNTLSGCSSHGMNFDFSTATDYDIEIDNNEVSICGRDGIKLAGLQDAESTVSITGNTVTNVNNDMCKADDGAIAIRGSSELKKVTITDNEVSNAQVGVYFDPGVVNDGEDDQAADITVSNNNITVVAGKDAFVGYTPSADSNNQIIQVEPETSTATLFVNDAWAGKTVGDAVLLGDKYYIYGTNAFAKFADAVNAAGDDTVQFKIESDITEEISDDLYFTKNGYSIVADKKVVINLTSTGNPDIVFNYGAANISENVSLLLNNKIVWIGYDGKGDAAYINGTLGGAQVWAGSDLIVGNTGKLVASGEAFIVRRGATVTVNGIANADNSLNEHLDVSYFSILSGKLVLNNTAINAGPIWISNTGGYINESNVTVWTNNTSWVATDLDMSTTHKDGASFTLTNGSKLEITEIREHGNSVIAANCTLSVQGSDFISRKKLENSGTIEVTGGSFTTTADFINNCTFKVSGSDASTVKAAITGNALQLENGVLANSEITGEVAVYGTNNSIKNSTVGNVFVNFLLDKVNDVYPGYSRNTVALSLDSAVTGLVYVGSEVKDYAGTLTVTGGSQVSGIYNKAYGTTKITGSGNTIAYISAQGIISIENAQNTVITSMIAEGGDIDITNSDISFALNTQNNIVLSENTAMTATDSTLKFQNITIEADSKLELIGTTVTIEGSGATNQTDTLTNNGTILMNTNSMIIAGELAGTGTITIDANGFSGIQKVIDITGAGQEWAEGGLVFKNLGTTQVVYGTDGDVSLVNVDTKTLYVNSAWADKDPETAGKQAYEVGEAIPGTDGQLAFGVNAFASSKDALEAANAQGGATIDVTGMGDDNDEAASNNGGNFIQLSPGTYTITGGDGASSKLYGIKFSDGVNVVFDNAYLATGKLGDGASGSLLVKDSVVGSLGDEVFAGAQGWFTYKNTAVKIENSIFGMRSSDFGAAALELPRSAEEVKAAIAAGTYTHPEYGKNHSGANFGTLGTVDVDDSTMYAGYISVVDRALMTVDNSVLYYGGTFSIGAGEVTGYTNNAYYGWDVQHSELSWVKPPHASAEGYREGLAAQVDITDSILYNIGYGDGSATHGGTALQVGGYFNDEDYKGILNITRSEVNLGQGNADAVHSILDITANGTVNMTDSTFEAAKVEIKEGGEFNITGKNTLTVDSLTNGGTVKISGASDFVADVTTVGDSIATKGKIYMDNVTLDEDTQITGDAFIRFASGENTLDGVSINAGYFQVGQGANVLSTSSYFEERISSINGVTVNVKNADINVGGNAYAGWIGGRYNPDTGAAENPRAKYVLNLEDSNASFGYLHTYTDGTLNYTATQKDDDGKFINTFHGGTFIVSGAANFDGGELDFNYATVNSNGKMSIKNASVVFSNSSSSASLSIAANALVDISQSTVGVNKTLSITEDGELKLTDVSMSASNNNFIINNEGTITVAGTTSIAANTFSNNGTLNVTGNATFSNITNAGTITVSGTSSVNIGTFSGNYVGFENASIVGDSNIGGNIRTYGNFELSANLTVKQSNFYGETTFKSGTLFTGSTTIVSSGSEFTLENGAEINSRFFNVAGGTAYIYGKIELEHSDPRQKLLQIHEESVLNLEEGGNILITRHNAMVKAGGTLNVNGGTLQATSDTVNVAPDRGGVLYNSGTVNVNAGIVDIKNLNNETQDAVVNISGGEVRVSDTFTNAGAMSISGGKATVATLTNNGEISISGGEATVDTLTNAGTITVSGTSTVNAVVTGEGLVKLAKSAVLAGDLTAAVTVSGTASLAGNASLSGSITSGSLKIAGSDNALNLTDSAAATLLLAKDTVIDAADKLGSAAVKGATNNAEVTLSAAALGGNKITNAKVKFTDVTLGDGADINADIVLADIKSVNGNTVNNVSGMYFYNVTVEDDPDTEANEATVETYILSKVDGGIDITLAETDNNGEGVKIIPTTKNLVFDANNDGDLSAIDFVMQSGTTTVKLANGSYDKKTDTTSEVEVTVNSIDKDIDGGVNNINVGNYANLTVKQDVARMGNITVGKNSSLTIGAESVGTSAAQTIKIGDNSTFNSQALDLAGGKATFTLGKGATATVNGNYTVAEANNSISLAAGATLNITGKIINKCGDNYDGNEVKYASAVGTTINLAKGATMVLGNDIIGLAGLTLANGSAAKYDKQGNETAEEVNTSFTAGMIAGTEKNNTINVGSYGNFSASDINLYGGNDTLKSGSYAVIDAGSVEKVETIALGAKSTSSFASISNVNKLTAANGTKDNNTTVKVEGAITGTEKNNTVSFGNYNDVEVASLDLNAGNDTLKIGSNSVADIDSIAMGEGKDILTIGANSKLTTSSVADWGVEVFNASKGAELWVNNGAEDVEFAEGMTGSWTNATIMDMEGDLTSVAKEGSVYANEWDVYDLGSNTLSSIQTSPDMKTIVEVWNGSDWVAYDSTQTYTDTLIRVGVDASLFDKKDKFEKETYTITATLA